MYVSWFGICIDSIYFVWLLALTVDFNFRLEPYGTESIVHFNCTVCAGHATEKKKMRKLKLKYKFTEATPCPCRSKIIRLLVWIQKHSIFTLHAIRMPMTAIAKPHNGTQTAKYVQKTIDENIYYWNRISNRSTCGNGHLLKYIY